MVDKKLLNEQGVTQVLLLALVLGILGILVASQITINRHYFDGKGHVLGAYLADKNSNGENSSSGNSDSGAAAGTSTTDLSTSSFTNNSTSVSGSSVTGSNSPESAHGSDSAKETPEPQQVKERIEKVDSSSKQTKEVKESPSQQTEVENEIKQNKVEIKAEMDKGELKLSGTTQAGNVQPSEINQLKSELEKNDIKIATGDGKLAIVKGTSGAISNFPLSLNLATNTLTVTTPNGAKEVAVLPDQAIHNMLAANVMNYITSVPSSGSLASVNQLIKLEDKNGVLGYEINGEKNHKLLGLIPINTSVAAFVSAENGQVVDTQESLWSRILDKVAP